jgi:hypothetical protein
METKTQRKTEKIKDGEDKEINGKKRKDNRRSEGRQRSEFREINE